MGITKGQWRVGDKCWIYAGNSTPVAHLYGTPDDARLISGAPDMLAALKANLDRLTAWRDTSDWLSRHMSDTDAIPHRNMIDNLNALIQQSRDAIAKAEGKE